jgi:acyl-CoA synthetase (AMP-forming)/AMP-acid ligase II
MDDSTAFDAAHDYLGRPWRDPLVQPPTVIDRIADSCRRHATLDAVTEVGPTGEPRRSVTYAELWSAVEHESRSLAQVGHPTGVEDTIGVLVSNDLVSLVTILAIMRAGRAAVIFDAGEPAERLAEMAAALGCAVLVPGSTQPLIAASGASVAAPYPVKPPWKTAVVVFTTGSTAASKAVGQSGYAVAVNAEAVARHHRLGPAEVLACPLPISHVNGLEFGMFASLMSGAHAVLVSGADPIRLAGAIEAVRPTLVTAVPSLLAAVADSRGSRSFANLRYFVSAAAALPVSTAATIYSRFGLRVVQGYGQSECMNFATTMPADLTADAYERIVLGAEIPPVGAAVLGCAVDVVDDDGVTVPVGQVGNVVVRGHSVMNGYLGNLEATRETFSGGMLWTGDRGYRQASAHGDLLTLTGRKKLIAKCGGLGVSLEEIERHIRRLPAVRDVVCVSRPHRFLGEAVTAFVAGAEASDDDIRVWLERWVRPSLIGLAIRRVDAVPVLRSGKPDRPRLTAEAAGRAG